MAEYDEWGADGRYAGEPAVIAAQDQLEAAMRDAARRGVGAEHPNDSDFDVLLAFGRLVDVERVIDKRRADDL